MAPVDPQRLQAICAPVLERLGYELVDLKFLRGGGTWLLRLFIDGPGGVTIDDCTRASRDLSAVLDVEDPIHVPYALEVSSPGLDRPLVREEHFRRFAGRPVRLRTRDPIDGRRNFRGRLLGADAGVVRLECEGKSYVISLPTIEHAHVEHAWDIPRPPHARGPSRRPAAAGARR